MTSPSSIPSDPSSSTSSTPYYPASLSLANSPNPPTPFSPAAPTDLPSNAQQQQQQQHHQRHSRRPSRAERYEHLVENARQTLEKSRRHSGIFVADATTPSPTAASARRSSYISLSGISSGGAGAVGGKRGSLNLIGERLGLGELGQLGRRENGGGVGGGGGAAGEVGLGIQQSTEELEGSQWREEAEGRMRDLVKDREWRETVRNLLLVVDGMSQQLSTHDELAAQLKIAQSNLTLAETHSEFLEETLRRREVSTGSSGVRNSTSMQRNGRTRTAEEAGAGDDVPSSTSSSGARGFFRLPTGSSSSSATSLASQRKGTIPPISFVSSQSTPGLRSVASSPRLGGGGGVGGSTSPTFPPQSGPSDPDHSRLSTSTIASVDSASVNNSNFRPLLSPNPSTQSLPNNPIAPSLLQDYHSLRTAYQILETECTALKVNEESLKRSNEMMVKKCADLEKTKEDLMSELENLSVELFSEANALVAEERRARAEAETKLEQLQAQLTTLTAELASLRTALTRQAHAQSQSQLYASSPDLPAIPRNNSLTNSSPLALLIPSRSASSSASSSPNPEYSPSLVETPSTSNNRPASTASVVSTGRKWFSFGRSPSIPAAPSSDSTASPNPSFSTPPLSSTATIGGPLIGSDHSTTPSLSLSPYLETNASTPTVPAASPSRGDSLGVPVPSTAGSKSMERSNSGSSFVTARSESWFGFGGSGARDDEDGLSEEPQEIGAGTSEGELAQEVIKTPVRSTFAQSGGGGPVEGHTGEGGEGKRSPRRPKKELSPKQGKTQLSPRKPQNVPPPLPRPASPSPSQMTTTSTLSSSNKDLPATIASPPLPPLPASTPLSSALSSPVLDDTVETDPTKLPFSSGPSSTALSGPSAQSAVPRKLNRATGPRPLAIHVAASSSSSSNPSLAPCALSPSTQSFLSCPSPTPSSARTTPTTPNFGSIRGGPTQAEMTAGAKSPKSPNELRWNEAVSSISQPAGSGRGNNSEAEMRPRRTSAQSPRAVVGKEASSVLDTSTKKDVLPPSPRSGEATKPLPLEKPVPSLPLKTTLTNNYNNDRTKRNGGGLRIDTSPSLPGASSVTPRPTERGPRSARPPSLNSRPNLFRHHSTTNTSTASPSSIAGLPQSTSNSSISSHLSDSSTGHSSTGLLGGIRNGSLSRKGKNGSAGAPLSPDGTKAVEDLEKLMESMMDMFD